MRSDLDSAAVSWDFCIWKSFRSVWRREYNLDLVTTAPGVIYRVHKTNGEMIELTNPSNLPDPSEIEYMEEPIVSSRNHGNDGVCRCDYGRFARSAAAFIRVWNISRRTRALLKYDASAQ